MNFSYRFVAAGGDAIAVNSTYVYAAMSIGNESNALVGSDYPPANSTWFGLTRRLRSNGEYDVLVEDDARAKILLYRWTPSS